MLTEAQTLALKLKNKYPMLQNFSDRTFGIEIEVFGLNYLITPVDRGMIKPYSISSRGKDGRYITDLAKDYRLNLGSTKDSWYFQADASVRGKCHTRCGAELTSPVLSGIDGLVEAYEAFMFLNAVQGVDIDASCGLHVHHGVDRETYNCKELQQLVRIVHQYEKDFYLLIPGDRQNSDTCRPIEIDVEAFLKICEADSGEDNCRIKHLWYSPTNRCDIDDDITSRYNRSRYHGLNLHSYWYRSTIEFRYHSAVLEKVDEAMQWIIFTQFLVELSCGHIPSITFYPGANKWLKTVYRIYEELGYRDLIQDVRN